MQLAAGPSAEGSVVSDDDQGYAARVEFFQKAHHLFASGPVEVACRLVGEQHGRLHDGGPGDGDALALPAGELVRAVVGTVGQAEVGEGAVDALGALGRGNAGQGHRQGDVLGGGEARHEVKTLEDETDTFAADARLFIGAEGGDVAPFEVVGAGIGPVKQAEQVEQG